MSAYWPLLVLFTIAGAFSLVVMAVVACVGAAGASNRLHEKMQDNDELPGGKNYR